MPTTPNPTATASGTGAPSRVTPTATSSGPLVKTSSSSVASSP